MTLTSFPVTNEALLRELYKVCTLHLEFWKVRRCDIIGEHTAIDKLRQMLSVYTYMKWVPAAENVKRTADETDPFFHVQKVIDGSRDSQIFPKSICDFIEKQVRLDGPSANAISRDCAAKEDSLPNEARNLIVAAKAFEVVESMHGKVKSGRHNPQLADLNQCLHNAALGFEILPGVKDTRRALVLAHTALEEEFCNQLASHENKVTRLENGCKYVETNCGKIFEALNKWDFKNCKFVLTDKGEGDANMTAAAKTVEQCTDQVDHIEAVSKELKANAKHQSQDQASKIAAIADKFESGSFRNLMKKAIEVLANTMVVNKIMTSAEPENETQWPQVCSKTLEHIKKHLHFEAKDLDAKLYPRVSMSSSKKSSKTPRADDDEALSVNSTGVPASAAASSSAAGSTEASPPKKKLKLSNRG